MTKRQKYSVIVGSTVLACILIFAGIKIGGRFHRDLSDIQQRGTLKIVTDDSFWGYTEIDQKPSGFNYEIAQIFADSLGLNLTVKVVNSVDEQIKYLQKGKCDIVARLVPITTYYDENISYSEPFFTTRLFLVQRHDTSVFVATQRQLAQKVIFIPESTTIKKRIENLSDEIADDIYVTEMPNVTADVLIQMLADGEIDYTVCTEQQARIWKKQYPDLDFSLPIGFHQQYAWVLNTDSEELREALNIFLVDFLQTFEYRMIYVRYF